MSLRIELSGRGTFTRTFDSPAGVIKGNSAKLDVPGADFWSVENGKIKDFNWYVNLNVMLEQMGIQPDFASAVKAQPGSTPRALHKRFLYAHVTSYRFQPALQSVGLLRAGRHVSSPNGRLTPS